MVLFGDYNFQDFSFLFLIMAVFEKLNIIITCSILTKAVEFGDVSFFQWEMEVWRG